MDAKRYRILFIVPGLSVGGLEVSLEPLVGKGDNDCGRD